MQINNKRRFGVVAAVSAAAIALGSFGAAGAAVADPSGAPTYRALAGVGSDTTQDLNNGLSSVILDNAGTALALGSYNATGSATIKTKATGPTFNRPNGSGNGVAALKAAKTSTAFGGVTLSPTDVQFARSSSAASFVPNGRYSYIPLALDAVTYAKNPAGAAPSNIPLGTSTGQDTDGDGILDLTLRNIYTRNATTTLETSTNAVYTVGNQASGAQIVPFIPQSGSGTRSFWQTTVGGSFGSIVSDNANTVQEHDGTITTTVTNAIVPFSIAQYVAQGNSSVLQSEYGVSVSDRREGAVLGQVNGIAPVVSDALNTAFPIARPVFTVVEYAELATNAELASAFQGDTAKAYTATRPGSSSALVITDFGFGDLAGGVTVNGVTYEPGDTTSYRVN
ncbi:MULTISPECIES: hypothetical protein [unclassified Microbacterium]|uniref:hypothetical protein n=1 Tax=unclassified Microbacterium TaxID=2609290 RepID=UPI000D56DD16|nr:hypothetical protein [Microbacterium sp. Gd 4-13]PVW03275.1 hypothetical protein DEA06_13815 [Microbacterium sp. Gd 4-13]